MNEHIDLVLTGAKMATWNNEAASLATHSLSAFYNISQMAWYRYQYYQCMNSGTQDALAVSRQYSYGMWKHTALAGLDVLTLIVKGITGLCNNR